ncbi:hypothetical protein B0H13DRAFT_1886082 [Mycena leptocephala]|nr:hypothetical protein B0H13DRAFT_1886082 [Mycena leptocephala]
MSDGMGQESGGIVVVEVKEKMNHGQIFVPVLAHTRWFPNLSLLPERPLHPLAPATASTAPSKTTKKTSKAATPADGEKKKRKKTNPDPDIHTVMSWPSTRFCLPPPDHLRWRSPRAVEPKSDTIDIHTMTMKKLMPSLSSSRSLRHVAHQHYAAYAVAAAVTPPPLLAAASAMAMGRVPPAQRVPRWKSATSMSTSSAHSVDRDHHGTNSALVFPSTEDA